MSPIGREEYGPTGYRSTRRTSGVGDRISVVKQGPHTLDDTLGYNLTIGNRDVSRAGLERVCEIARIDEFVEDLPEGFDTTLGDDGVRLSGGQRQRVALGRVPVENADVLVLDDAQATRTRTWRRTSYAPSRR